MHNSFQTLLFHAKIQWLCSHMFPLRTIVNLLQFLNIYCWCSNNKHLAFIKCNVALHFFIFEECRSHWLIALTCPQIIGLQSRVLIWHLKDRIFQEARRFGAKFEKLCVLQQLLDRTAFSADTLDCISPFLHNFLKWQWWKVPTYMSTHTHTHTNHHAALFPEVFAYGPTFL